ncbi:MAG TPA: hypothetical protein VMX55_12065 [candidate division Zixibacteria bacterium]|nr:hypothetical protein [candidate division Zixibacteria bacterium]
MSNSKVSSDDIKKLATYLSNGDRKGALSLIRSRLNEPIDESEGEYEIIVWRGWERAINRQENEALVYQMLNGLSSKVADEAFKDLRKKKTEILIRDHTQTELSKVYLSSWVTLLEHYCALCKD